jgi:trehalose synthase
MREVEISSMSPDRFEAVLHPERFAAFERGVDEARELLDGRVVWNVNSTARGGGVVELLESLVAYARGAGVDVRWGVIEGSPEFFTVTKRIHNRLHGAEGDGGALDDEAHRIYQRTAEVNLKAFAARVRDGDVVIVHDPQPAGLIEAARTAGAVVIWRCHVGLDRPNHYAREAWSFLRRYVANADAYVFSRESFVWEGLESERINVIPPSIDVFSPKNQELDSKTVSAVLGASGVLAQGGDPACATFSRHDGTPGRVDRKAELFEEQPLRSGMPVVLQVSRWDALKDPLGVIGGFAEHVPVETGAHLVYAGPAVAAVADDPEGARVLREAMALRHSLPVEPRSRVHLVSLPMEDPEENAGIVAGGGVSLLRAQDAITLDAFEGDEKTGARIVHRALEEPLRQIADNSGLEGSVVVNDVRNAKGKNVGLNAESGEIEDLVKAGVIDPAMVTRSALQNAASIAKNILTTEAIVAEMPEKDGAGAGMPGGMGGMDGMM